MGVNIKKIIKESAGISFEVREWSDILYYLLGNLSESEPRLIVDGQDYPEQYEKFSVDYFVLDFNDWTNGYLDQTSGYDKDVNYVVHIMLLNRFRDHQYMRTILNHELKHAYQDWQRQRKGYPGIGKSKESQDMYTDDFVKVVKDRIDVGQFYKEVLKYYYLLSDLELDAFMENVYDRDVINDYKKMINKVKDVDIFKEAYYEDQDELEKNWDTLKSLNLPFIKKYKDYTSFLSQSSKYFKKRSEEILRKLNKMEYVHRDRE
jgi:ACT domain-containing protein